MRLRRVDRSHAFRAKAKLAFMRMASRSEPPDIVKTVLYRPEYFGKPVNALFQAALRGPSDWTVGEREAMAAFVSALNQCVF
jgi:hypothetical protein